MSRTTLLRRYGPLLAVAAVQLLIIAVVPSTAQRASEDSELSSGGPGTEAGGEEGAFDPDTGEPLGEGDATGGPEGGGGAAGGGASTAGPGGGGGSGGGDIPRTGDTSHCVGGKQYDPALYHWAPPCVPKFVGDNGGAPKNTRGVTKEAIKVVALLGNYGPTVQRILESQGSPSYAKFSAFADATEKFLNANYEFYGRKIDIVAYQFKAITGGEKAPNDAELRNEIRQIVQTHNPFAVTWANSVSSGSYDELSKLKVVNLGGYGFTDDFNAARRPYHWDVQMGGYQLADRVSTWYCTRMHGGGAAKAVYAKSSTGRSMRNFNLQDRPRKLGIITTDDPENLKAVVRVKQLLKSKCGVEVKNEYQYAQDVSTLPMQRQAAYDSMVKDTEATTIMCFCDQVAPQFLYKTLTDEQYFPEHVVVATGVMDLDRVGQTYDHGAEYPTKLDSNGKRLDDGVYEQYENAFGLAQFPRQGPSAQTPARRIWNEAKLLATDFYLSADEELHYYTMLAGMLQMAGPRLTASAVEAGATRLGVLGTATDERSSQRSLGPGDYTWNDSLREVYWAPKTRAPFNGIMGTYVSLNGGRAFVDGDFPPGLLALPPKPRP